MKTLNKQTGLKKLIFNIMIKKYCFFLILLFISLPEQAWSQVAINTTGNPANSNSMLDVSSTTKGLLVPRMTSLERNAMESGLSSADKGMLVFDTTLDFFFYYDGNDFKQVSDGIIDVLQDEDGDTKIEVEHSADEDLIRYKVGNTEYFVMHPARIDVLNTGRSVFIGEDAGKNDDLNVNQNIGIGYKSLGSNITGYYNTGIGSESITRNTTGRANTGVGCQSLFNNTSGQFNTALGYVSGYNIDDGDYNTAIGVRALYHNENGHENTAVGNGALHESTGSYNTAIGRDAGYNITSGESNIMIGRSIYAPSSTDNYQLNIGNLIFGTDVDGTETTISSGNIGIGNNDPYYKLDVMGNIRAHNNSGHTKILLEGQSGSSSVYFEENGYYRASVGYSVDNEYLFLHEGGNVVVKDGNMGIGNVAPQHKLDVEGDAQLKSTTGNVKLFMDGHSGNSEMEFLVDGVFKGSVGYSSGLDYLYFYMGDFVALKNGNMGIGFVNPQHKLDVEGDAQLKSTTGNVELFMDGHSGNSEIEFQVDGGFAGSVGYNADNDYLYFYEGGNVVVKNGNLGIGTTTPGYRLQVGNSGDGSTARANAWQTFSDRSLKRDLSLIDDPIHKIEQVSGYYYYWKDGDDKSRQTGVIAQEVEEVLPEIVQTDAEGIKSLDYSKLTPLLIEAVKEQQSYIEDLENRLSILEKQIIRQ